MTEYAIALWAMTAARHQWPATAQFKPPSDAACIECAAPDDSDRLELRRAMERFRKRATGNLILDRNAGFYVPELKDSRDSGRKNAIIRPKTQ